MKGTVTISLDDYLKLKKQSDFVENLNTTAFVDNVSPVCIKSNIDDIKNVLKVVDKTKVIVDCAKIPRNKQLIFFNM